VKIKMENRKSICEERGNHNLTYDLELNSINELEMQCYCPDCGIKFDSRREAFSCNNINMKT